MCKEIEYHVEMRPYGWDVLFDEPVTMHKGDALVMEGLLLSSGEPKYERVCIRRREGKRGYWEGSKAWWQGCEGFIVATLVGIMLALLILQQMQPGR